MDWTPWIGIIGAAVGGSIGLLGQRISIREQRRKDLLERVVEFLREVDLLDVAARRFLVGARKGDSSSEVLAEMRSLLMNVSHQRHYLEMTAPFKIRQKVRQVEEITVKLSTVAMDRLNADDPEYAEDEYDAHRDVWMKIRNSLVFLLRPNIDAPPVWMRRPFAKRPTVE